jgi:Domain of unknown function (DUF4383)
MRFIQKVTAMFGVVFIAVALLGFITGGMSMDAHMSSAPRVAGLFPVNSAHNAVHLAFGVWAIFAAKSAVTARRYCLLSGAIYLLLAGIGFVLPETFGLIPIGGNDITLHAVLGIALTMVGAMSDTEEAPVAA